LLDDSFVAFWPLHPTFN